MEFYSLAVSIVKAIIRITKTKNLINTNIVHYAKAFDCVDHNKL